MRENAKIFYPTWEDLFARCFTDYVNELIVKHRLQEGTVILIQMPDEFNKFFNIDKTLLFKALQPQEVLQLSIRQTGGINGIYDLQYSKKGTTKSVKEISRHIQKMEPSTSYEPLDLFSRQYLSNFRPMSYLQDLPFSYVDKVYESSKASLPEGWNFHRLQHELQSIFKGKDLPGITSTLSYVGQEGTMTPWHREDFCLCAVNYLLPGSADKVWISSPSKYQSIILSHLRQSRNFDKSAYSSCFNPLHHNAFSVDAELFDDLNIPLTVAVQKPGMVAVVLPAAYHQVSNAGVNFAESVNFICHRWDVHAHRQNIFCCEDMALYYSSTAWDPLVSHYFNDETNMKKAFLQFQQLVVAAKKKISSKKKSSPIYRQISPDLFEMDASTESAVVLSAANSSLSKDSSTIDATTNDIAVTVINESSIIPPTITVDGENTQEILQKSLDEIFNRTETTRQTRQQIRTQELQQMEEELQRLASTQPMATAHIEVGAPLILSPAKAANDISKDLKNLKRRQYVNVRDAESKRKYEAKRAGTREQTRPPRPKTDKSFDNALYRKRQTLKSYEEALKQHDSNLRQLTATEYSAFHQQLLNVRQDINQMERQRELRNGLTVIFKKDLMQRRELQGYVNYEVARDYIDGQNGEARELFKTAVSMIRPKEPEFWNRVTVSQESWNDFFGVDPNFRVPAHEYGKSRSTSTK